MQKFDNKGLGFSLNKVFFPIVFLTFVICLSFPVLSEEKKMKCYKWGQPEREMADFYKFTRNIFGKQKFFIRHKNEWVKFCEVTDKNPIVRFQNFGEKVKAFKFLRQEVGDKAIECNYLQSEEDEKKFWEYKLLIDFDMEFTKFCYKRDTDKEFECARSNKAYKCEVIKE